MSSTSKITGRSAGAASGARAGSTAGASAAASTGRSWSVTCSAKGRSPLLLIAISKEDGHGVHEQQHHQHHEDGGRRQVDELPVGVLGPGEDLDRQRREGR